MKKIIVFLMIVFMSFGEGYDGKGYVGKSKITAKLNIDNDFVYGTYYYNLYKKPILVTGLIKNGNLTLNEGNEFFQGILKDNLYKGKWKSKNKIIDFEIVLSENKDFEYFSYAKDSGEVEIEYNTVFYKKNDKTGKIINNFILPNEEYEFGTIARVEKEIIIANIEKYYKEKTEEYLEKKTFYEEDGMRLNKYSYGQSCEYTYQDLNYISLLVLESYYTGGAHAYANFYALNINLTTGELLKLSDIFIDKYLEYLYEKLTKKYSFYKEYYEKKYFVDSKHDDFFIDEKGFLFITDPYGWGMSENVRIDYDEINSKYYNKNSNFYKNVIAPKLSNIKSYNKLPTFDGFIYK